MEEIESVVVGSCPMSKVDEAETSARRCPEEGGLGQLARHVHSASSDRQYVADER